MQTCIFLSQIKLWNQFALSLRSLYMHAGLKEWDVNLFSKWFWGNYDPVKVWAKFLKNTMPRTCFQCIWGGCPNGEAPLRLHWDKLYFCPTGLTGWRDGHPRFWQVKVQMLLQTLGTIRWRHVQASPFPPTWNRRLPMSWKWNATQHHGADVWPSQQITEFPDLSEFCNVYTEYEGRTVSQKPLRQES